LEIESDRGIQVDRGPWSSWDEPASSDEKEEIIVSMDRLRNCPPELVQIV